MKHIYFDITGSYSDHIITDSNGIHICTDYYYIRDILNREWYLPMASTMLYEEQWDEHIEYLSIRYKDALKEIKGQATGVVKKNK